ncbi:MAG: nucleotidyltransferase domain-containing protein [Methanocellales archaeon]|nr:nucleotidyltransferase domain-containing protein [Methanocellales archaeon]
MTVKRTLDLLVNQRFLTKKKVKNQILYKANMNSAAFKHFKIAYNLAWLEEKGVVKIIRTTMKNVRTILLFGSYAKGENDAKSDVDLLVISRDKQTPDLAELHLAERLEHLGRDWLDLGREVNLLNFSITEWSRQAKENRALYLDVITEGIVLYGTRPVVE